ncbi:hypothetical protein [Bradyrhizobium yuanmingense]|uniref:hypothetical protein n=1 Tax=Bradyrhizobium yuanmingense TaxID=108015 RepID=UPI003511EFDE
MLLYQLLRPLAYMTIKDESKWKIDILLPLCFAIACTLIYVVLPKQVPIFSGSGGFVTLFIGLLQILPGFYLTALAAVATFNRPDMDFLMPRPAPRVTISVSGVPQQIELTRRRMLSMLFGYLTFVCFALYFGSVISLIVAPNAKELIAASLHWWILRSFVFAYAFFMGQLIFITMFGLYQLSDRMHQPDIQ